MGQTVSVRLWRGVCGSGRFWLVSFVLLGSSLTAMPVAAQEAPSTTTQDAPKVCYVVGQSTSGDAVQQVRAFCWGTGLMLGEAETFRFFVNPDLEATLVELEWNGTKRVLLLRPDAEGRPLLEDLSGTLAASAGRASWSGLDGLALDYEAFAREGTIGVAPAPESNLAASRTSRSVAASAESTGFSIRQLILEDEARQAGAVQ